jgi:hypothetical protein
MKLIDLTKKRQVQKSSVAAGKDTKLKLDVLGISIGQKQSNGLTSQIMESMRGNDALELLEALSDALEVPIFGSNADGKKKYAAEAAENAIQWYRLYIQDTQKVIDLSHDYMHSLRISFLPQAASTIKSVASYGRRLKEGNVPMPPFIDELLQKVIDVESESARVYWYLSAVLDIWEFIYFVKQKVIKGENRGFDRKIFDEADIAFAKAVMNRLGLRDES